MARASRTHPFGWHAQCIISTTAVLTTTDAPPPTTPTSPSNPERPLRTVRSEPLIVVADDGPEMCALLADICEEVGSVVALPGGRLLHGYLTASVRCEVPAPAVIVSDVRMPAFGGLNALSFVSQHLHDTKMILVTAFGDPALHASALRRGARCVIDKPFEPLELLEAVRGALAD